MSSFSSENSSTTDETLTIQEDNEKLIPIFKVLNSIVSEVEKKEIYEEILKRQKLSVFSSETVPSISIECYLSRIFTYSRIEMSSLISALIYLDRACKYGKIVLTKYNIHKMLFVSILTSIKINEDEIYKIDYYAKIAGVSKKELIKLEYEFLCLIKFNLFVPEKEYNCYANYLEKNSKE